MILARGTSCFISCEGGRACPDGWTCFVDYVCMIGELPVLEPYAACDSAAGACPEGATGAGLCLEVPDDMAGTGDGSVCSTSDCDNVADCPAAPATGNAVVTCTDVIGDGSGNCYLDCAAGQTCADGMVCHPNFGVCYWPGM
jgi:hypothetical protein